MIQELKKIAGLDLYVREDGKILDKYGREVETFPNENGYLLIQLYKDKRPYSVHKLVAKYFYPKEYGDGTDVEVHHKDRNKLNNRADNLEIKPKKEHREEHTGVGIKYFMYEISNDLREVSLYALIYEMTHNSKAPHKSLRVAHKVDYDFVRTRIPLSDVQIRNFLSSLERKGYIENKNRVYTTYR